MSASDRAPPGSHARGSSDAPSGRRRSEKTYNRLVQAVARAAGSRGSCTPRTLRHTFLSQLARRVRDPEVVVRLGNVSPKEAIRYCRGAARDRDAEVVALMEGA